MIGANTKNKSLPNCLARSFGRAFAYLLCPGEPFQRSWQGWRNDSGEPCSCASITFIDCKSLDIFFAWLQQRGQPVKTGCFQGDARLAGYATADPTPTDAIRIVTFRQFLGAHRLIVKMVFGEPLRIPRAGALLRS